MSMMSEKLMPSACEVDVAGAVAMYAMQLASGKPSALVDWNNNYGDDPDKCVFFHCGNWAKAFLPDITIATAPILGTTLGEKNTYGALAGRTPQGPVTFGRVTTDDREGRIRAYVGEGRAHRRSAEHLRHARGRAGARASEADAIHLPQRLRAPRRDERLAQRGHPGRGHGHLPGVGRAQAFLAGGRVEGERKGDFRLKAEATHAVLGVVAVLGFVASGFSRQIEPAKRFS